MPSRVRGFVFTLNNYSEEELQEIVSTAQQHCEKYIFGKEIAPTTKTPHIQGYLYWKNAKTISASREMLPLRVANHEPAKGTPKQNYVYCSKEGDFITNMSYDKSDKCEKRCICDKCILEKARKVWGVEFKDWKEMNDYTDKVSRKWFEENQNLGEYESA